jgi:hypothetical protein
MPYYPKSQFKPDLYTNGNEYVLSTTEETYKGNYYEISNGNKFTGKNPDDGPNILLTPQPQPLQQLIQIPYPEDAPIPNAPTEIIPLPILEYVAQDPPTVRAIPKFNLTLPTDQDKVNGQFNRYFCKKNNEVKYLEISKDTYQQLQNKDPKIAWDLYTPTIVLWAIQGNQNQVFLSNKATIQALEQNIPWPGFTQYFQDKFLKYYLGS